jgi:hypothetical protein
MISTPMRRKERGSLMDYMRSVGVLDTGVSRSTCSWAPSTAQLWLRGRTTIEASREDPHEQAPHEEINDQNC